MRFIIRFGYANNNNTKDAVTGEPEILLLTFYQIFSHIDCNRQYNDESTNNVLQVRIDSQKV